jgi:sigma-B regulation protein RsbU (phosphoserine phosphatase)
MSSFKNLEAGQQSTKSSVLLVLGENPFSDEKFKKSKKTETFETVNLKYLPDFNQLEGLTPEIVYINYDSFKESNYPKLNKLCDEIKNHYGNNVPILVSVSEKNKNKINKRSLDQILENSINLEAAYTQLLQFINENKQQRELLNTIQELEEFKNDIHKELELASIFQGSLFNEAIARTNLKTAYHYLFKKEIGGDFFRIFELSVSHVGIMIGEVRGRGSAGALLTGFILGELFALNNDKHRVLWSPSELLSRLSESIYSHNKNSEFYATAWYGVLNLTNGKLIFSRAGHPSPIICSVKNQECEIDCLHDGNGFPMGTFPGMTYRESSIKIEQTSKILFHTDGLLNQKDINGNPLDQNWLFNSFKEICLQNKPLKDIPALIDSTFTDLSKGAEPFDDRVILCCEIGTKNQSYVKVIDKSLNERNYLGYDSSSLTIDQILGSLSKDIESDLLNEFEIALQEIFFKANTQIQKAKLIALETNSPIQAEGFTVSWWVHNDRLDLSVQLDDGAVPWAYTNSLYSNQAEDLEGLAPLLLFYDNIQINHQGLEVSMSKIFG